MGEVMNMLKQVPLFESLASEDLREIEKVAIEKEYPAKQVIFFEDDPGDSLFVIRTGSIKIFRVAEDGREKTLAHLYSGDVFGEMAILDNEPRSAMAETLERSKCIMIMHQDFNQLLGRRPAMAREIVRVLSKRLRAMNAQVMDVIFKDVHERVIRTLVVMLNEYSGGQSDRQIALVVTHQELANLVGTSRETVSRVLAELQSEGIISIERRRIIVANPDRLFSLI